ncbi:hypothetical protein BDR26DRAFT_897290 [Obelidium mucronatum]|nr:hypothetical protein BDR26DRAFT_897290 [Obelidium mucronatum]
MDDSTLRSLKITSKKNEVLSITPPFSKKVKEYSLNVGSDIDGVQVSAAPNEGDAFVQVQKAAANGIVAIAEGQSDIIIKCDAADGSSSNTVIHVFRPSASDATLKGFQFSVGNLTPDFHRLETCYVMKIPSHITTMNIIAMPTNATSKVESQGSGAKGEVLLNFSETAISFLVTSADGTCKQNYSIAIQKANAPPQIICPLCPNKKTGLLSKTSNEAAEKKLGSLKFVCPFAIYGCTSIAIENSQIPTHATQCTFAPTQPPCKTCWDSKKDSLSKPIEGESHKDPCTFQCEGCQKKVSNTYKQFHESYGCLTKREPLAKVDAPPEPSGWESSLVDKKSSPSTVEACIKAIEPLEKEYLASLAESWKTSMETGGKKPTQPNVAVLDKISKLYATAIALNTENKKLKGGVLDETLHLQLGLFQEEIVCCKHTFPPQELGKAAKVNNNAEASASFMSDEIDGLLMGLGVAKNASDATKIKAMEEEFHRLLAAGLSDQAAEVQGLHQWKVQQVNASSGTSDWSGGANASQSRGEGGIANALEKYEHAVGINPNSSDANYHLGRLHLQLGNYEKAQTHLEHAISNKPIFPVAMLLLAVSIASPKMPKLALIPHSLKILEDAIPDHHTNLWLNFVKTAQGQQPQSPPISKICESVQSPINTNFQNAHIALSKSYLLSSAVGKAVHPINLLLSILPQTLATLPPKSKIYQTTSLNMCQARKHLLHLLPLTGTTSQTESTPLDTVNQTTILSTTLTITSKTSTQETNSSPETLTSIEQVSASIVFRTPTNASGLSQLGKAQLDQLDANPRYNKDMKKLQNAIECFEAAAGLECPSSTGANDEEAVKQIQAQDWFTELKQEIEFWSASSKPKETKAAGGVKGGVPGKKGAPAAKTATAKPAPTKPAANNVSAKPAPGAKAPAGKPAAKATTTVPPKPQGKDQVEKTSRPTSSKPGGGASSTLKKGSTSKLAEKNPSPKGSKSNLNAASKQQEPPLTADVATISENSTFDTHIGLARAFAKKFGFVEEANAKDAQLSTLLETLRGHYQNAIKIKPGGHDAYIELGALLERKVGIRAAADLYSTFPFPVLGNDNPNQDDLYLFAELGRCFMKEKRFKEPLLKDCLIAEGRAMGMPCLGKYVDALDKAGESKLLMAVYAGVNKKV